LHNDMITGRNIATDDTIYPIRKHDKIHSLIVSDIHLGSRVSRSADLMALLKSFRIDKNEYLFDRLILLGDIFDNLKFKRLDKKAWELISLIRGINDERCNAEVVWILGNHDRQWAELMENMVGTKVYREYIWSAAGKRYLAMHGDRFDKWVMKYPALAVIPCWIYDLIQELDGDRQRVSRFVKEKSKVWLRINDEMARGIIAYAERMQNKIDAVFCGHSHMAEETYYENSGIWYYNTGCWTGRQLPTYATVSYNGEIRINEYVPEAESVGLVKEREYPVVAPGLK